MDSRRPITNRATAGKTLPLVLGLLVLIGAVGAVVLHYERRPEISPVARGARLIEEAGCYACHGRADGEKRFNLRIRDGKWSNKSNPTFWDGGIVKTDELVEWITKGVTADEVEKHKKLFIKMPAYEKRFTPDEIQAMAAWILAEAMRYNQETSSPREVTPGQSLDHDQLLVAGDRLSRQHGCYQCHGELGQGGISNPDSFKGYIPGFQGRDFLELTAQGDRTEILHWIDHGRGQAIESGPLGKIAKYFTTGQATQMPGYRDQLTQPEKELLTAFMLQLNQSGPLPAKEIERLVTLLNVAASN